MIVSFTKTPHRLVTVALAVFSSFILAQAEPTVGKCFAHRVARNLSQQVYVLSHAAQPHSLLRDSRRGRQHLRRRTTAELGLVLDDNFSENLQNFEASQMQMGLRLRNYGIRAGNQSQFPRDR